MNSIVASQLPITAEVNDLGHLEVGGRDLVELQREYGSPLYVFDEATLRGNCRTWKSAFETHVPHVQMFYAAKALAFSGILDVIRQEGWGIDVVSEGEIRAANHVGFNSEDIVTVTNCCIVPSRSAPITGPIQVAIPPIIGIAMLLTAMKRLNADTGST